MNDSGSDPGSSIKGSKPLVTCDVSQQVMLFDAKIPPDFEKILDPSLGLRWKENHMQWNAFQNWHKGQACREWGKQLQPKPKAPDSTKQFKQNRQFYRPFKDRLKVTPALAVIPDVVPPPNSTMQPINDLDLHGILRTRKSLEKPFAEQISYFLSCAEQLFLFLQKRMTTLSTSGFCLAFFEILRIRLSSRRLHLRHLFFLNKTAVLTESPGPENMSAVCFCLLLAFVEKGKKSSSCVHVRPRNFPLLPKQLFFWRNKIPCWQDKITATMWCSLCTCVQLPPPRLTETLWSWSQRSW